QENAQMIFDTIGVETLDELLAISDEEINEKYLEKIFNEMGGIAQIYADGKIIPENWWDDIREGSAKDIKVMMGSTSGENDWIAIDYENFPEPVTDPEAVWE